MSKTYCLLNHELTQNQLLELKEKFGASEIIYPSEALSKKWSQIPAVEKLDITVINDVIEWLSSAKAGDALIAQGEFGATFMIVDYALKRGLAPLYAVTKRVASERREGEIVSKNYIFEHVCFRRYEYFSSCAIV
ncbi:MAG: hypothetical protein II610_01065 [Treponema sp.]|nr:hypothetical protein [Treponema sp.]